METCTRARPRQASVAGSPYPIVPSSPIGTGLANYAITFVAGTLTVDPAALTITANGTSKTYGATVTFAGTEFSVSGLLSPDTVTSVTLASTGAPASASVAGSAYDIDPSAAIGTGLDNYTITYVAGALTVNPAALTITANGTSKTYGATVTFAGTEFSVSGLLSPDTVTSVTLTSAGAAASASVAGSPYPIVASAAVGTGLASYTITYVAGALTVTPASLTVTVDNTSRLEGQPNPIFTATITGFVAGETLAMSGVTGSPALSTVANLSSPVGTYPITAALGSLAATSYTFVLVDGTLTVLNAPTVPLTKSVDKPTALPGETLVYTILYANNGSVDATEVVITDTLPAFTMFASATGGPSGGTLVGSDVIWDIGTVAPGVAGSVTLTVTLDSAFPAGTTPVSNSAVVTAAEVPEPILSPPVTTVVTATPALAVAKVLTGNADEDGSLTVSLNDTLTYTVTATNTGNVTLTNVVVSDSLTGDTTTCATVAPGATCVLTAAYTVTQADVDAGAVVNTGTADSDETDPVTDPHTEPVPQTLTLAVAKVLTGNADEDGSLTVSLNDTLTYTVTATNTGNVTLTNVVVSDSLTGDTTTCATVAPGATCVLTAAYTVTQADVDAGAVVNTGTADSDETDPVTDPHTEPVPQTLTLAVAKVLTGNADEDGSLTVSLNDTLTYTVTATNTGNVTLTNVVVSDSLTGDTTTCATVAPGATCVLTAAYTVTQADVDAGAVVNTGTADSDETDPVTDPHTEPVPQTLTLAVAKVLTGNADEDGSLTVSLNDTLTYTVTATNTGNVTLTNVVVSDSLTGDTTTCATVAPGATCVLTAAYTVTQADVDAGAVVNTGTADSDETDPVTDPHTEPVPQTLTLAVAKVLTGQCRRGRLVDGVAQ